jgi:GntR family transcriptional regulator
VSPAPRLRIDPALPVPIWSQIEDAMRRLVAAGALRPGQAVPSVRELAREQRVNPNTVVKAYQRLCEAGVLETRRGEGTFVTAHPPAISSRERARTLREAARRFTAFAATLGVGREEALASVRSEWPDGAPSEGGGRA